MAANVKSDFSLPRSSITPASTTLNRAARTHPRVSYGVLALLAAAFWLFVTLTDVLYGYSMQIYAFKVVRDELFVRWYEVVLQHILLFPILFVCLAASLRMGWAPIRRVLVQIMLGGMFAALSYYVMELSEWLFFGALMPRKSVGAQWTASFVTFFMTYRFGPLLATAFAYYQRFRDAEVRNSALEQGWSNARLAALRMQLSPHTLFNLLHTIRGHINKEPQVARAMVVQLADLLRRLLSASQREFALLPEELTFVRLYLELQQQRFAERLEIVLPAVENHWDLWVPTLILQPLVENAVVHGLAGHAGPVQVSVEASVSNQILSVSVTNTTAVDVPIGAQGVGLRSVRERLVLPFTDTPSSHAGPSKASSRVADIPMPLVHDARGGRTRN